MAKTQKPNQKHPDHNFSSKNTKKFITVERGHINRHESRLFTNSNSSLCRKLHEKNSENLKKKAKIVKILTIYKEILSFL